MEKRSGDRVLVSVSKPSFLSCPKSFLVTDPDKPEISVVCERGISPRRKAWSSSLCASGFNLPHTEYQSIIASPDVRFDAFGHTT